MLTMPDAEKPLPPTTQPPEPMSHLHGGVGFIRHVDPAGVMPSVSWLVDLKTQTDIEVYAAENRR